MAIPAGLTDLERKAITFGLAVTGDNSGSGVQMGY